MDFSKYPLDKLMVVVAGIIPGFVALLIYDIAVPGSFTWFFALGFLGYRAKLSLIVLTALLVGYGMSMFLYKCLAFIGGAIGGLIPPRPPHSYEVAPWRDPAWRVVLRNYVGSDAPDDTHLMTKELYDLKLQQINLQREIQRPLAVAALNVEKLKTERDDLSWSIWYQQFHQTVLEPADRDFLFHVQNGLKFNLETASVYVLVSAALVAALRHWWCILPASFWTMNLILEETVGFRQMSDRWSTLARQITYLSELRRK